MVRGVSLTVEKGEVVSIIGGSGSGKSTLLMCINGLEPIDSGSILVDGIEVHAPRTDLDRLRRRIAPQLERTRVHLGPAEGCDDDCSHVGPAHERQLVPDLEGLLRHVAEAARRVVHRPDEHPRERDGDVVARAHAVASAGLTLIATIPHGSLPVTPAGWVGLAAIGLVPGIACGLFFSVECVLLFMALD